MACMSPKKFIGYHELSEFPKNFVKISERLYACKFETSNGDYVKFLNNVKYRMNPAVYQSLLPDTVRWRDKGFNLEPYVKYYLHHPAYASFPLVNINYEQANFYCTWLTQRYMNNPNRPFKKVVFKLPSRKEWQLAAGFNGNSYPWGNRLDSLPKGVEINYNHQDFQHFTQEVNYKKARQTGTGMYHILGNVSEMISSKGECMGGNFRSAPDWLNLDAPNEFYPAYLPCPLVGFRIFMVVVEP